jgi:tetratricopeptide (TPR) repeat protein
MPTIPESFALAAQHYQSQRLQAAEQICRQILAAEANHADALHLLGLIAARTGQHDAAAQLISSAIALRPNDAIFHSNLGSILKDQGNLQGAVACCRRAIELNPDSAAAHYNLGAALQSQGRLDDAIACFQRAIELKPAYVEAHNNLGTALLAKGWPADAACCFRRSLELNENNAAAHYNLGTALQAQQNLDAAIAAYRRALELDPGLVQPLHNLGTALQAQGKLDQAIECYSRALHSNPNNPELLNNLGTAFQTLGKPDEAVASYARALHVQPDHAAAYYNLGSTLQIVGKLDEAVACFERALKLKPDYATALNNLGKAFDDLGKPYDAIETYGRALALAPDSAITHSNRGSALTQLRRFDDALACYARALALNADCGEALFGKAILKLLTGDFKRGWPEYEWRWKTKKVPQRDFREPQWDGSPLQKRTILLHAEQGFGDTIQFVRYAAVVKRQNPDTTVLVECQRPLAKLLAACPGIDHLAAQGDALPPFDVQAPLLSVPGILKTSLDTIPAEIPYLSADPALVDQWRERLKPLGGLRIGINWRGRPTIRNRDIPIDLFRSLAALPGVHLVNLQKGATQQELAAISPGNPPLNLGNDLDTAHGPFIDTAAVIMNLDLVISSDTAVPHLAGALGAPVWLALPFVPDWRWLLDRNDSPWYPTMRIFRQPAVGDWAAVFQEIRTALLSLRSTK